MKAVRLLTKVLTIIALSVLLLGCSAGRDLLNDNEEQADHTDAELLYVMLVQIGRLCSMKWSY